MNGEKLLSELVSFKTINNPSQNIFPDSRILEFINDLVLEWDSDFKRKIFRENEYSSLFIAKDLERKCDILFMGHLDVVPITQGWKSDPFKLRIESGLGYGRGVKDCKGSIVSALLMLKNLCEKQEYLDRIGLFFSLDEETGGSYGTKIFFEYLKNRKTLPSYVINVDGGPRVVYKRRAGFGIQLSVPPRHMTTIGKVKTLKCKTKIYGDDNRHSAYFVKGVDSHAVLQLSKMLHIHRNWKLTNIRGSWVKSNVIPDEIEAEILLPATNSESREVSFDENLTKILRSIRSIVLLKLNPEIESEFGTSVNPNVISYSSTGGTDIYFDVRIFLSSNRKIDLINAFKERLFEFSDDVKTTCTGSSGYFYTDPNHLLVNTASSVLKIHSLPSEPCEQEGASDARFASALEVPCIDLGPKGGGIHGTDEYIDLASMREFGEIYKEIVSILLKKNF